MIKGRIYTIRSHQTDKYYIGSTTQILCKRLQDHRVKYKRNAPYMTSYEIIKYNDNYIELLENYECNDRNELRKREGVLQREHKNNIVNRRMEHRTRKEYLIDITEKRLAYYRDNKQKFAQYYLDNKKRIQKKGKENHLKNKEKRNEKRRADYLKNKEKIKQYQIDNSEKIKEKRNVKCNCICSGKYTHTNKLKHEKTKTHLKYVADNPL